MVDVKKNPVSARVGILSTFYAKLNILKNKFHNSFIQFNPDNLRLLKLMTIFTGITLIFAPILIFFLIPSPNSILIGFIPSTLGLFVTLLALYKTQQSNHKFQKHLQSANDLKIEIQNMKKSDDEKNKRDFLRKDKEIEIEISYYQDILKSVKNFRTCLDVTHNGLPSICANFALDQVLLSGQLHNHMNLISSFLYETATNKPINLTVAVTQLKSNYDRFFSTHFAQLQVFVTTMNSNLDELELCLGKQIDFSFDKRFDPILD